MKQLKPAMPELAFDLREFTNVQLVDYFFAPATIESRELVRAELLRRGIDVRTSLARRHA